MGWVGDQKMSHSWCSRPQNRRKYHAGWPVLPSLAFSGTPAPPEMLLGAASVGFWVAVRGRVHPTRHLLEVVLIFCAISWTPPCSTSSALAYASVTALTSACVLSPLIPS
jgi:hypothetical protein